MFFFYKLERAVEDGGTISPPFFYITLHERLAIHPLFHVTTKTGIKSSFLYPT